MTLFSYVVDHDTGFAPNPSGRFCTLVHCKHGGGKRRKNIVELAEKGDWIIGTGGQSKKSCGNGRVIYVMRVDEKILFAQYLRDPRFQGRIDCLDLNRGNEFALISKTFLYFGREAIPVNEMPVIDLDHPIEKKGPGFRSDFSETFVEHLAHWVQSEYSAGKHGEPCAADPGHAADVIGQFAKQCHRPAVSDVIVCSRDRKGPGNACLLQ